MSSSPSAPAAPTTTTPAPAAESSCCTTDGSCSSGSATAAPATGLTTVYAVAGMTCGHCRSTVTRVVGELDGVTSVAVDLEAGTVTVTTAAEPDDALLSRVIEDAGYELTGRV